MNRCLRFSLSGSRRHTACRDDYSVQEEGARSHGAVRVERSDGGPALEAVAGTPQREVLPDLRAVVRARACRAKRARRQERFSCRLLASQSLLKLPDVKLTPRGSFRMHQKETDQADQVARFQMQ